MLSFECIKNEKSVYFLLTSAARSYLRGNWAAEDIMVMKMLKNRRAVKDVCRELDSHRGIRPQIIQSLKKCDIYEKIISEQARKGTIGISEGAKACRR